MENKANKKNTPSIAAGSGPDTRDVGTWFHGPLRLGEEKRMEAVCRDRPLV